MIPYGRQTIEDDDIEAVVQVLRGDWLTQGPHVEEFEEALATRVGAKYAVAFANGTAALHGCTFVGELGPGDRVATSSLSFVASANCARYVGADITFVDIDRATLNLDPTAVPPEASALVAVHFAGLPVDLASLTTKPRFIIEDAAHAIGAETPDGPVGSCARSDVCVFSFHPVKAITAGEGGAVTTNDDAIAEALRSFRNHGMVRRPGRPGWQYDIGGLGFNYRLTDIQAALARSQLSKLDRFIARRQALAARYHELLTGLPLVLPPGPEAGFSHAYHLFPVLVEDRNRVYEQLRAGDIGVQVHYRPIHQLLFDEGSRPEHLDVVEHVGERLLSLPLYPTLSEKEQDTVVEKLGAAL